MNSTLESA